MSFLGLHKKKKNIEYIYSKETFTSFKSAEIAKKLQNKEENRTNNQTGFKRSFVDFRTQSNLYRVPQMPWSIVHVDVPD